SSAKLLRWLKSWSRSRNPSPRRAVPPPACSTPSPPRKAKSSRKAEIARSGELEGRWSPRIGGLFPMGRAVQRISSNATEQPASNAVVRLEHGGAKRRTNAMADPSNDEKFDKGKEKQVIGGEQSH